MVLKQLFGKKDTQAKGQTSNQPVKQSHAKGQDPAPNASEPATAQEPATAVHLEQAILENARNDNAETRKKVYQELLFSDLLLTLADKEEGQTHDPNHLNVAILTNQNNIPFSAAFTSAAAARRWRPEGGNYVAVRGQDIYKLLEPSPAEVIVINPGSAPFVVLPKVEFKQLALGIVPQSQHSPVQVAAGGEPGTNQSESGGTNDGQMQVAFPPDVFTDEQKNIAMNVMTANTSIIAAALGAILPPNAAKDAWIRTVFLRVEGLEESQEAMQNFCLEVRNTIVQNQPIFNDVGFEVGVMPDPGFWVHIHENNLVLFDKNPPPKQAKPIKEGVVDAIN